MRLVTGELDGFRRVLEDHDLGFSDALEVVRSHFRHASQAPGQNAVVYTHDGHPALLLAFTVKGELHAIDVGRGLRDDDLARLTAAFTAPRPRHVMGW
jgi:hypothetical protein